MKRLASTIAVAAAAATAWAQTVIDVHSHNIMPVHTAFLSEKGALLDEGFPLPAWNADQHLRAMDDAGVDCAVLTMPAPHPYFGDTDECRRVVREYNEQTAAIRDKHPGRFLFCAALPLPDTGSALREAAYAFDTLRCDGVKLATNCHGQYLGDESLDSLMEFLDKRKAIVIIHPHKPFPPNDGMMATVPLAMTEYPAETTRAVVNMIMRRIPERFPNIKFVVPHCGSFLPLAIPRMKGVLAVVRQSGDTPGIDIDGSLGSFYFDVAGNVTADNVAALLSITTPDHLLFGTDYPYTGAQGISTAIQRLKAVFPDETALRQVMGGNAARLFGKD